jgi:hypothetical protein
MPSIWDLLDSIISLVAITGLFSYAYKKRMLAPRFWTVVFITIIAWDFTYNLILTDYLGVAQQIVQDYESSIATKLVGLALVIPEYIALYLLAFKSDSLWKQ